MRLADLDGRRVAILGAGREGRAAAGAIAMAGIDCRLSVLDEGPIKAFPLAVEATTIPFGEADLGRYEVLIRSPGISCYRPEIVAARARGSVVTSATNLWFGDRPAVPVIGVTGTKGKSTTCSLIAHLLSAAGWRVELAGNIGRPLLELSSQPAADCYVVELSSYQLADFDGRVEVAVLTNLRADHLDWHGSLEVYRRDKLRLLERAGIAVVSGAQRDLAGNSGRTRVFDDPAGWQVLADRISCRGGNLAPGPDWSLVGRHNRSNLAAALAAVDCLDAPVKPGLEQLHCFEGLPHRLQTVANLGGVQCIDDSISTTPESALAALESFAGKPVALIVGGHDRGLDWQPVIDYLQRHPVALVVTQGQNGPRIHRALALGAPNQPAVCVARLQEAVSQALASLECGIVLLSPGAPSFDQHEDYVQRGAAFAQWCRDGLAART